METIRKTVESKYAPKQTNVVWVDTSKNPPIEKHFIKGKWKEMGGNGCKYNLPEPSEDNLNNVLGVVAQSTGNFNTIVPTQQIDISTYDQETHQYTLSNVDTQYFVEGAEIYLSNNDSGILPENVSGTVVNENGVLHCLVDTGGGQVDLIYVGENQMNVTFTPQVTPPYIPYITVASPIYDYQYGFVNQQSSGSCLPEVNAEDVDKVLQVRPVEISSHTNTYEVISETNVEFSQYGKQYDFFNIENMDLFIDNAECVVTINGNEYTGTVHIETILDLGDTLTLRIYDNQNMLYVFSKIGGRHPYIKLEIPDRPEIEETYTISLSTVEEIKEYDYEWQKGVSIPVPEKGDADKILAVVEEPSDETGILIPEQELTTPVGGEDVRIPNANISDFVVGANVKATIQVEDNTLYLEGTVTHDGSFDVCELTNPEYGEEPLAYILLDSNTLYLGLLGQVEEQIAFTISATIPLLENKYQLQTLRGILINPNSIIPPSGNTQPKSVYSKIVPGNIYVVPYRINNLAENYAIDTFLPFIILDFNDNTITGSAALLGIFVSMINSSNMVVLNTISQEINSDILDAFYLNIDNTDSGEYELSIGDNQPS